MNNTRRFSFRACAVAVALGACAATANAIDLRSWDQKISNASQRFVVLSAFNNEAVLDKETQLVWQHYVSNADGSQPQVSRGCRQATIGGRMGWRLPTVAELATLIDPSVTTGVKLPSGHPFETMSRSPLPAWIAFWTSTLEPTSPQDPTSLATFRYFTVDLDTALIEATAASTSNQFICVRGADPASAG